MNKNYIIWGISDKGYEGSMSSSYLNNIIPGELKKSISDDIRKFALTFAKENRNEDYFYSIEQVASNVLYTIYRTNFLGGATGNRMAYDAATIIISKNYIIGNPLNALNQLITSYKEQKDSGFGNFNFENILNNITLLENNDKRSISKIYKQGFIKYNSKEDLSSQFVDKKAKLHNFNKVYFFTGLSLFEEGEHKIQDLKNYKTTSVKIKNFDANYYDIYVENKKENIIGEYINVYDGDEIIIFNKKTRQKNVDIAKPGLIITLKEIKPPKIKPLEIENNPGDKRKKINQIIYASCTIIVLVISGFIVKDNYKKWFAEKTIYFSFKPDSCECIPDKGGIIPNEEACDKKRVSECNIVIFDGNQFTIKSSDTKIDDPNDLLTKFKQSILFNDFSSNPIKLHIEDDNWKISEKDKPLNNEKIKKLKAKIKKASDKKVTKEVLIYLEKVINYNALKSEKGLDYENKTLKIDSNELKHYKKKDKIGFITYEIDIESDQKLKKFLKANLPTNILNEIISNHLKYKKEVKIITSKPKTKTKDETRKIKEPCEMPYIIDTDYEDYWDRLIKYEDRKNKDAINRILKTIREDIKKYEECECDECKDLLKDEFLNKIKKDFF